jgi:hypothetical protein
MALVVVVVVVVLAVLEMMPRLHWADASNAEGRPSD